MSDLERISNVLVDILECQAMIFAEEAPRAELEGAGGPYVGGSIRFAGAGCGSLELLTTVATARSVAANMLGLDIDDPEIESSADDALCELINVAMGRILTEMFGFEAVFNLTPPTIRHDAGASGWSDFLGRDDVIGVSTDDDPVLIAVHFDEAVQPAAGEG